jgi:hypothetical protein
MIMSDKTGNVETAVDVRPIREGLRELAGRMPEEPEHVHAFGKLLAAYMNDHICPGAIPMVTGLMMCDLARGKSGYSHVTIPEKLSGMPAVVFATLDFMIPAMLRAAAGPEHVATAELLIAALESA